MGSPLKRRRIIPSPPITHPGPPPRPWTRPRTRPPGTPPTMGTRSPRRRPPTTSTQPRRAPPSITKSTEIVHANLSTEARLASRWPSWRSTSVGTWPSLCSSISGSTLDTSMISKHHTTECSSGTDILIPMTGSICTSHDHDYSSQAVPPEGDPGGHRHHQPAQDGTSTQLFGCFTMNSLPDYSIEREVCVFQAFIDTLRTTSSGIYGYPFLS